MVRLKWEGTWLPKNKKHPTEYNTIVQQRYLSFSSVLRVLIGFNGLTLTAKVPSIFLSRPVL